MLKVYKKEYQNNNYEVRIINLENGEFTHYLQDKNIGFTFSHYKTDVYKMGYKSVEECIKQLKERDFIGKKYEIDYKEQRESERIGLINLGVERIKRANRVNTNDFEDVILKLANYGLGFCDAQNQIVGTYEYYLEEV